MGVGLFSSGGIIGSQCDGSFTASGQDCGPKRTPEVRVAVVPGVAVERPLLAVAVGVPPPDPPPRAQALNMKVGSKSKLAHMNTCLKAPEEILFISFSLRWYNAIHCTHCSSIWWIALLRRAI